MGWLVYLFAVAAGSFSPVQAGANAQLRKSLDQPLLAALCVYSSALIALLFALPFTRLTGFAPSKAAEVPWWAWLGGLLSIMSTMAGLMLADQCSSPPQRLLAPWSARYCSITLVGSDLRCIASIRGVWSDVRCYWPAYSWYPNSSEVLDLKPTRRRNPLCHSCSWRPCDFA